MSIIETERLTIFLLSTASRIQPIDDYKDYIMNLPNEIVYFVYKE